MRDGARVRIGVAVAAVGAVLALAGGRAGAEPVGLSVSTTTGVAAGQVVDVVVTATPGTQVGVCQALAFDVATQGACVSEAVDHGGTAVAASFPEFAGPRLTVTPDRDVVAGQDHVLVEGEGFTPGAVVGYCQGFEGYSGPLPEVVTPTPLFGGANFCGIRSLLASIPAYTEVVADADGRISGSLRFERDLLAYLVGQIDCADPGTPCPVHAFETGRVPQTFVSSPVVTAAPPPSPAVRGQIAASAAGEVGLGTDLTIEGTGFRSGALVDLFVCLASSLQRFWDCDRLVTPDGAVATVEAGSDGSFPPTVARLASLQIPTGGICTDQAGTCVLAAAEGQDFAGTVTTAPLPPPPLPPTVVPGSVTEVEGRAFAMVPVSLSHASSEPVTVQWSTLAPPPGSELAAHPGEDFVAASGTMTFAPGRTREVIPVHLLDDGVDEPSELFAMSFHHPVNARMGGFWGLGFVAITDDDPTPVVLPGSATVVEGDAGTTSLVLPVTLSSPSARTVSVPWETLDPVEPGEGFADPPGDFVAASGTVTFPPGALEASVEVQVVGDQIPEPSELVVLSFHDPAGARMGGFWGLGFGGITDDE